MKQAEAWVCFVDKQIACAFVTWWLCAENLIRAKVYVVRLRMSDNVITFLKCLQET